MDPNFDAPTAIVTDPFAYVELWLKRYADLESRLYWRQAGSFYSASAGLPYESRAVTAYYSMLNAAKALLTSKGLPFTHAHGLSGRSAGSKTSLANEISAVQGNGVFVALTAYYGANLSGKEAVIKDVLYNLPFVHRAYTVTYRGSQNLFIPIVNPRFVRQSKGNEAWFCADIVDEKYCKNDLFARQRGWETDNSQSDAFVIRRKRRFQWDTSRGSKKAERMRQLRRYHGKIRRDIKYIHGAQRLWYFKRNDGAEGNLSWPTPSLILMAMHRLSELTRYDPRTLHRHFECQHNWLLSEFIEQSLAQFVDQMASDITGHELMEPGYR